MQPKASEIIFHPTTRPLVLTHVLARPGFVPLAVLLAGSLCDSKDLSLLPACLENGLCYFVHVEGLRIQKDQNNLNHFIKRLLEDRKKQMEPWDLSKAAIHLTLTCHSILRKTWLSCSPEA